MKVLPALGVLLLWPSFHGCDGLMLFTEPQPAGSDTLATFPEEWQGCYRQQDDSAYVEVGLDRFTVTQAMRLPMGEEELLPDTADDALLARLKVRFVEGLRDSVFIQESKTYHVQFIPEQRVMLVDEVGQTQRIGKEFSLRRLGGRLCLSVPIDSLGPAAYQVDVWERRGGNFLWSVIKSEQLDAINKVVDLPGDTLCGPVSVKRRQFARLVRNGAYQDHVVMIPCTWCASSLTGP